eukprot:g3866.t1
MGTCGSKDIQKSRALELLMRRDNNANEAKVKLLLLGGGQCGKSTFFKQIKVIYGKPYSKVELDNFSRIAYSNAHSMLLALIEGGILGLSLDVPTDLRELINRFMSYSSEEKIDAEKSAVMQAIWKSPVTKEAWARRAEFQVDDSCDYWMENLHRLEKADYQATKADVMRTRVRTTGIIEDEYIVNGVNFVIIDVGGQRNERSKWLHCFDDVTAIIFMCAMSGFNQVLFEDDTTNRLMESVMLFQKLANSPFFKNTDIILFLNKLDLFEEKILNCDIRNEEKGWFDGSSTFNRNGETVAWPPAYTGGCDADAGREYIRQLFQDVMPPAEGNDALNGERKKIYTYETIATHKDNIQKAFNACKDIILKKNVSDSGF